MKDGTVASHAIFQSDRVRYFKARRSNPGIIAYPNLNMKHALRKFKAPRVWAHFSDCIRKTDRTPNPQNKNFKFWGFASSRLRFLRNTFPPGANGSPRIS